MCYHILLGLVMISKIELRLNSMKVEDIFVCQSLHNLLRQCVFLNNINQGQCTNYLLSDLPAFNQACHGGYWRKLEI